MACCLAGAKPLSEPMMAYCYFGPMGTDVIEILIEIYIFSFKKMHLNLWSGNLRPFCLNNGHALIQPYGGISFRYRTFKTAPDVCRHYVFLYQVNNFYKLFSIEKNALIIVSLSLTDTMRSQYYFVSMTIPSPWKYWMSFVRSNSDWSFADVLAVLYALPCMLDHSDIANV